MTKACVTLPRQFTPDKVQVSPTLLKDLVASLWNNCKSENVFRYALSEPHLRCVPGRHQFCVDYNEHRHTKKREAQAVTCCNQPFNDRLFNFNKLKDSEILLQIKISDHAECITFSMEDGSSIVSINASPLSEHHVLLLPYPESCLNQRLTLEAVELGLSFAVGCGDPDMRIVFNSLRAFASINHLHLHAYKCSATLPVESAPVEQIVDCCFKFTKYPVPGFVFELQTDTVQLAKDENIPHNMMITYGDPCYPSVKEVPDPVLRVCLWPVTPSDQLPVNELPFKPAVCEISGHVFVHDLDLFQNITESQILETLKMVAFEEDKFLEIVNLVKRKLSLLQSASSSDE